MVGSAQNMVGSDRNLLRSTQNMVGFGWNPVGHGKYCFLLTIFLFLLLEYLLLFVYYLLLCLLAFILYYLPLLLQLYIFIWHWSCISHLSSCHLLFFLPVIFTVMLYYLPFILLFFYNLLLFSFSCLSSCLLLFFLPKYLLLFFITCCNVISLAFQPATIYFICLCFFITFHYFVFLAFPLAVIYFYYWNICEIFAIIFLLLAVMSYHLAFLLCYLFLYAFSVRGLPIPDPHQKTTPLSIIPQRHMNTLSGNHWKLLTLACCHLGHLSSSEDPCSCPRLTCACLSSPAVGQLLIYSLSYHFIIYYGTICYISPPYSVFVYIPPPLQRSPFFPLRIPARSVSTLCFTFLLHVIIISSDPY